MLVLVKVTSNVTYALFFSEKGSIWLARNRFAAISSLLIWFQEILFRWQEDKAMRSGVLSQYKLPIDLVDISTGKDPEKLLDLVQAVRLHHIKQNISIVSLWPYRMHN